MDNIQFIAEKFRAKLKPSQQEYFEWWLLSASERREVRYAFEELKESVNRALVNLQKTVEHEKKEKPEEKEKPQESPDSSGRGTTSTTSKETRKILAKKKKDLQKKQAAAKAKGQK